MVLMMLILLVSHDLDIEITMLATLTIIQKGYTLCMKKLLMLLSMYFDYFHSIMMWIFHLHLHYLSHW